MTTSVLLSWAGRLSQVWHAPVVEAEDSIRDVLQAYVIPLETHRLTTFRWQGVRTRFDPVPPVRFTAPARPQADVGVVVFPNGHTVGDLRLVKGWRDLASRWVAVVHELWPSHVQDQAGAMGEVFAQFDAVSIMTLAGARAVEQRFPNLTTRFAPFAIDGRPLTHRRAHRRGVTLYNPGRRDAVQHAALREAVADELYLFDTFSPGPCADLRVHRQNYMNTIRHSRLMLTNHAKFDSPQETLGAVEVGLRITEALGGGAVPIGHHPDEIDMDGLDRSWFGPRIPVGHAADHDLIQSVLADTDHADRVAFEGPRFVALHHDWSNRAAELLTRAGVDLPESLEAHQDKLKANWTS